MNKTIALLLLFAALLVPVSVDAGGKKGKLSNAVEVTRKDIVRIERVASADIDGMTVTITLDHTAVVLVQGVLRCGSDDPSAIISVVVNGQSEPDPLVCSPRGSIPILHLMTLEPGTHTIKLVVSAANVALIDEIGFLDRRLVVLSY